MATILTPLNKLQSIECIVGQFKSVEISVANRSYLERWPHGCVLKPVQNMDPKGEYLIEPVDYLPPVLKD